MARQYSDLERNLVLQRLVANAYNVHLTSIQTKVSERTLFKWRAKYLTAPPPFPPFSQGTPSLNTPLQIPPLPASEMQALRDIQRQLMEKVNRLSHSIDEAIDEAPLAQRAVALSQLIDRIIKLSGYLPPNPEDYLLEDTEDFPDELAAPHTQPPTTWHP